MVLVEVLGGVMVALRLLSPDAFPDLQWTVLRGGPLMATGPHLVVGLEMVLESLGLGVLHIPGVKAGFLIIRFVEIDQIILKMISGRGAGLIDQCHSWIGAETVEGKT